MDAEKKIIWAEVRIPERKRITDCQKAKVVAKLEGSDEIVKVFEFYEDEVSFTSSQFIGKTLAEAVHIFHQADVAYLRS